MDGKDNARSWLVLGVVTFSVFLEVGIIKSFSVLLPDLKEQLQTHTWIVGSCIGIITGFGYTFGASAGALVHAYSPRVCIIACGFIASIGLIICSCAVSPFTLFLGLILTGFLLLQENVAIGVIPEYFDKYFETAVGIYATGTGLGIVVMPIVTQFFLDIYGWKGALILISGLSFHSIPCGALIKHQTIQKTDEIESKPLLHPRNDYFDDDLIREYFALKWLKAVCEKIGTPLLSRLSFIAKVLVPGFVWGYTLTGWMIYMVSFAISNGASPKEASIVATCGGIGIISIRCALPLIHKFMTYKQVMYISSIIQAIALSLTTFFVSFPAMCGFSIAFGLGLGAVGAEIYIAARVNSDESEHYHAIAWLHVAYGVASILSGTLTGLLYDITGSFAFSFNVLAIVTLGTVVSLGLEDIWRTMKHSTK